MTQQNDEITWRQTCVRKKTLFVKPSNTITRYASVNLDIRRGFERPLVDQE